MERVTGGEESDITAAPWTASIEVEQTHIGGGVIVSRAHIVTTASTVDELPVEALAVRVGSSILGEGGLSKAVLNVTVHPEYNRTIPQNNDIALLRLRFPLSFGESIRAIPIAVWTGQSLPANSSLLLTGWQLPEDNQTDSEVSNTLQQVELRLVQRATCQAAHGNTTDNLSRVGENMFCANGFENAQNVACAVSGIFIHHLRANIAVNNFFFFFSSACRVPTVAQLCLCRKMPPHWSVLHRGQLAAAKVHCQAFTPLSAATGNSCAQALAAAHHTNSFCNKLVYIQSTSTF